MPLGIKALLIKSSEYVPPGTIGSTSATPPICNYNFIVKASQAQPIPPGMFSPIYSVFSSPVEFVFPSSLMAMIHL